MKHIVSIHQASYSYYTKIVVTLLAIFGVIAMPAQSQNLDVPYVPTPQVVVDKMLDMANVQKGDYVIDLGSGDGRIVISAVKRGAYGHGVDLDPERIKEARKNAKREGLSDQVMFVKGNIFDANFSRASVVTMYLLNSVNQKLRPKLLDKLEPGTRVVSHSFNMGDWKADRTAELTPDGSSRSHKVYYWIIPAKAEGSWSWKMDGNAVSISIDQQYQEIDISTTDNSWDVSDATLKGKRISFKLSNANQTHLYSGRVEGDSIKGMSQTYKGDQHTINPWTATHN